MMGPPPIGPMPGPMPVMGPPGPMPHNMMVPGMYLNLMYTSNLCHFCCNVIFPV